MPKKSFEKPIVKVTEAELMKEFAELRAQTRALKNHLKKQTNLNKGISRNMKKMETIITKFNQELLDAEMEIFQYSGQ